VIEVPDQTPVVIVPKAVRLEFVIPVPIDEFEITVILFILYVLPETKLKDSEDDQPVPVYQFIDLSVAPRRVIPPPSAVTSDGVTTEPNSIFLSSTVKVTEFIVVVVPFIVKSEKLTTKTSATGTVTHDLSTGSIFYHSSISNNFTANFTNVPTTNDRAIGVSLVLAQGVTPYMSTALQIDGSAQTIKWVNNITPTGTASKVDIVGFSLIRTGSAWTVLGQYSTYG